MWVQEAQKHTNHSASKIDKQVAIPFYGSRDLAYYEELSMEQIRYYTKYRSRIHERAV